MPIWRATCSISSIPSWIFTRNLHNVQVGDEFNSMGKLEIPYSSLVEFTVNALVHRSLNLKAPVRIFIFDNRVEIHSPGDLPNGLTIDDIKLGTSMPRNMFLFNNAIYLLPYTGVGSGITRALDENINVTFNNNASAQEFVITVWREESNQVGNQVDEKSNQVEEKSNQVGNQVDGKSNQVEDSDTQKCHCLINKGTLSISVLYLVRPQKLWNAWDYLIKQKPRALHQLPCRSRLLANDQSRKSYGKQSEI